MKNTLFFTAWHFDIFYCMAFRNFVVHAFLAHLGAGRKRKSGCVRRDARLDSV